MQTNPVYRLGVWVAGKGCFWFFVWENLLCSDIISNAVLEGVASLYSVTKLFVLKIYP